MKPPETTGMMEPIEPAAMPGPAEIAELAYTYWLADGCPDGRDLEHWLRAEARLARPPLEEGNPE